MNTEEEKKTLEQEPPLPEEETGSPVHQEPPEPPVTAEGEAPSPEEEPQEAPAEEASAEEASGEEASGEEAQGEEAPAVAEEEAAARKTWFTGPLRLIGTLGGLCVLCGALLGVTELLTADRIAQNQGARYMYALEEVLPYGEDYREIRYTGVDAAIEAVYEAEGAGWVFQVSPANSFSGTLTLMVGVNLDGTVAGVTVVESGESPDLGLRASEPEFRDQFVGKTGTLRLTVDDGTISAVSGATITSRAVCAAVNSALAAAGTLG